MGYFRLGADMSSASGFAGLLMNVPRVFLSYRTTAIDATAQTTYTFTSQDIGTASPTRFVVAGFTGNGGTIGNISSATIAGSSATQLAINNDVATAKAAFYGLTVASGTTATFTVTFAAGGARAALVVYVLDYLLSTTPTTTGKSNTINPLVNTVSSVTAGGVALAIAAGGYTNTNPVTWTGVTLDVTSSVGSTPYSSASQMFFTTQGSTNCSATMPGSPAAYCGLAMSLR